MVENYGPNSLQTEKIFHKVIAYIHNYRYAILGSLIAGLLAYTFMFTNKLPNHDDVFYMFSKGAALESGRWGLYILSFIFPDYSMPWIYGILSLLILAAGNCILVRLFSVKNAVLQFLLGAVLITFPSQIGTFSYMFTSAAYAIAYFMSVSAAYIMCKCDKKLMAIAFLAMFFSLSIYQAYISITCSIMIVFAIYQTIACKDSAKPIFKKGLGFILFLILSTAVYMISTQAIMKITGETFSEYTSDSLTPTIASITEGIKLAYQKFVTIFRNQEHKLVLSRTSQYVHFYFIALILGELMLWIFLKKDILKSLLLLFLMGVLPLGINLMYLFSSPYSIHTLVLYSASSVYVLLIVVIEQGQHIPFNKILNKLHVLALDFAVTGLLAVMFINIYAANEAYLNMSMKYENAHSFATSVVTHLQNTPGYTKESEVALIGDYSEHELYTNFYSNLIDLTGVNGVNPDDYSFTRFFDMYTGTAVNWASETKCAEIAQSEVFASLPSYPEYGYVSKIGDTFVIKLS